MSDLNLHVERKTPLGKLVQWAGSLDIFSKTALTALVLVAVTIPLIAGNNRTQTTQNHAATIGASITITPSSGQVALGGTISVSVTIDGGGQTFNAAQASISASPQFTITSVTMTPDSSSGCHFSSSGGLVTTPTTLNPSFVGAYLGGALSSCTLYSMTLKAVTSGTGAIVLTNGAVVSNTTNQAILPLTLASGSYIISVATPTPTNSPIPTATLTPIPSMTPTTYPTPTSQSLPTPTLSPTPQVSMIPSVTPTLFPTQTLLQKSDINSDGIVNIFDFSALATDWLKPTAQCVNPRSDINGDGIVDILDLSILATYYGQ